ncbi:hypothetical protein [Microbacterium sp. NIBRBAC000506063]|uniref:hypothetical protein n=1 Tax=Microbacterium sp. NIBRBAC000506063 TaxID=2734618 RepID=UPI001BB57B36|nr:hypothetical protein [Microbacterium sp. NIBRBAC000506063]QTV80925.1 hypothetical protein KAE78_14245 [Microbacterium sp. NIBRBAC000506063]
MSERRDLDPTLMRNQPSLRTASGTVWVIIGALFVLACLIPLALIVLTGGPAVVAAVITIAVVLILYATIVVVRFSVPAGTRRLRTMAICLLGIAVVALAGMLLCVAIVRQAG